MKPSSPATAFFQVIRRHQGSRGRSAAAGGWAGRRGRRVRRGGPRRWAVAGQLADAVLLRRPEARGVAPVEQAAQEPRSGAVYAVVGLVVGHREAGRLWRSPLGVRRAGSVRLWTAHISRHVAAPSPMSRKVIGVDLGGTKLLAGVVDEQLEVHDRVHRVVTGMSEQAVIDAIVESVSELIKRNPDVEAVGFGIPCLIDQRDGHRRDVREPAAGRRAVPRRDVGAAGRAGIHRQRRERHDARRDAVRRRAGRARRGRPHDRDRDRRRPRAGRKALPRPRREAAPSSATW